MGNGLKQCDGETRRQRNAEGVAIACCIFSGDKAAFAGNAQLEKAA